MGTLFLRSLYDFLFNKLQKLEDALIKYMLTAADMVTGVTWETWVTGLTWLTWVTGVTWVTYLKGGDMGEMSDRG